MVILLYQFHEAMSIVLSIFRQFGLNPDTIWELYRDNIVDQMIQFI